MTYLKIILGRILEENLFAWSELFYFSPMVLFLLPQPVPRKCLIHLKKNNNNAFRKKNK